MLGRARFAVLIAAVLLASCGRNSSAEFAGTWFDQQGRPVPERVIQVSLGPKKHCGLQSIAYMILGWPVGTPREGVNYRSFVRDPKGLLGLATGRLDTDARPPANATPTGFHHDEWELWIVPSEGTSAYLVSDQRVERWPLGGGACA